MARAQASLGVLVAVFSFDADPSTSPARALHVLTVAGSLPGGEVATEERFAQAAVRLLAGLGMQADTGLGVRRAGRPRRPVVRFVGMDDTPSRARNVTGWYYAAVPFAPVMAARWLPALGRHRLDVVETPALQAALAQVRVDARTSACAAALVGEVFTGDDLLRVHTALYGGPRGSERSFRRGVQELREAGVLLPVPADEVPGLRQSNPRFRSPAGTGGRPPELLRHAGVGSGEEHLAAARAHRPA